MLVFHGISADPDTIEKKASFQQNADQSFLIAYPYGQGLLHTWHGAGCCSPSDDVDVEYAERVIEHLESGGCAQPGNTFATGFSNGAFMVNKLICENKPKTSDPTLPLYRAIATHSGLLGTFNDEDPFECKIRVQTPVLGFHGTADPIVPYDGKNRTWLFPSEWMSVTSMFGKYESQNLCDDDIVSMEYSATTTCVSACDVRWCTVKGLGHAWSGYAEDRLDDIDATSETMAFFHMHMLLSGHEAQTGDL
jgi:polyhydroxybutyrate depolymerase